MKGRRPTAKALAVVERLDDAREEKSYFSAPKSNHE